MSFIIEEGILKQYIQEQQGADILVDEGVVQIGFGAFAGSDIRSISLPKTLTYIDSRAFQGCKSLEKVIITDGLEEADNFCFADCVSLKSISLPQTLKQLGKWMFKGCTELEAISLPTSIINIGDNAFEGCSKLKSIMIPDNVRHILSRAFLNCILLEKVVIGKGVIQIWDGAFEGCTSLCGVEIDPDNEQYKSIDGQIFDKTGTVLKLALPGISGHYSVPEGTRKIGMYAFYSCRLMTAVTFPETLKDIGYRAFYDCTGLTEVTIPWNVSQIESEAFGKSKVQDGSEPEPIKSISVDPAAGSVSTGGDAFFLGGTQPLVYPELPITFVSNKEEKRRLALGYCLYPEKYSGEYKNGYLRYVKSQKKYLLELAKKSGLHEVETFFENLESTKPEKETNKNNKTGKTREPVSSSVSNEKKLTVAEIKKSWSYTTTVWDESYTGTESLKGIVIKKYKGNESAVEVPVSVGSLPVYGIDAMAFANNTVITEVLVPAPVFTIGYGAFANCANLKRVEIRGKKIKIASRVFDNCQNLEEVILPDENTSVGSRSFQGCIKLTDESGFVILGAEDKKILCDYQLPITMPEITVPEGVEKIACGVFAKERVYNSIVDKPHKILRKVVLPSTLKAIEAACFADAISLQQVIIPDGLESIGQMAFSGCSSLADIYIPNTVTFIGGGAFSHCNCLKIHGEIGSLAEEYAKERKIQFIAGRIEEPEKNNRR